MYSEYTKTDLDRERAPKHRTEGKSVLVGRVEVARFTDNYQAERFVKFIEEKGD